MTRKYLIDIAQNNLLDRGVLQNFTDNSTIATANDEHFLRVWVTVQWEMGNHFLITDRPISVFGIIPKKKMTHENSSRSVH